MTSLLRRRRNDQVDWTTFDAEAYRTAHYGALRDDDREIITLTGQFFADASAAAGPAKQAQWRAVDVGTGSNLYPSFATMPFSKSVELREFSATTVAWLEHQRASGFDNSWDGFWAAYCDNPAYKSYVASNDIRRDFQEKTTVQQGSVFDLPRRNWDLGTMYFVACSLSTRRNEFERAVESFVGSLKPGAPFAAAFMTNSGGYQVRDEWFPAVSVDREQIRQLLKPIATRVKVQQIQSHVPVRPKVGMALATGFAQ